MPLAYPTLGRCMIRRFGGRTPSFSAFSSNENWKNATASDMRTWDHRNRMTELATKIVKPRRPRRGMGGDERQYFSTYAGLLLKRSRLRM